MDISDELVERACAAEQATTGLHQWPEGWAPEFAAEYRLGMRAFLVAIVPYIEAAVREGGSNASCSDRSLASNDDAVQTEPRLTAVSSSA